VKRTCAIIALVVTLAGCTTTRYVSTPCLTKEQHEELKRSEPPKIGDKLTGNAAEDIKPIAGSNVRLRAWGKGLLNVLGGCTE
jgi:hypothetical protein